ncbi:MAG: Gfo/Idh/MocA family oxidoreductase [Planctomycetota bacterium]|nr:Gfo/Idh/MocA family oxidoreductase [Planctomycetota bacterium]
MTADAICVAVVGVGHMGRHHARIYSEIPQSNLVAVVDTDRDRAGEIAEKFGAAAYTNLDEIPDSVRAATVAVPTEHHLAVASELLARGIAVLVEKPLAANVPDAEKLLACAREHGSTLSVGHTERFNPVVRAMQRLEIEPRYIESTRISPFSFRSADIGVVSDMMIHDIDIVLQLVGSPVARVDAVGVSVLGPHEDVASARVHFENGAVANLTASRLALKTDRRLRVFCDSAYLSLDYHRKTGVAIKKDANLDVLSLAKEGKYEDISQLAGGDFSKLVKVEPLQVDDVEPLRAELEAFIDSVRAGLPPAVSAEDGIAAMRLAADIVASLQSHRWTG